MRKNKNAIALGLLGNSSWEHKIAVVDFSHDVAAGALTITKAGIILPPTNTSLQLGGPQDAFPDALTAISGTRQIGTGKAALAVLTGVFVVRFTPGSPPTIYNPASGTVKVSVSSVFGANGGNAVDLTAAFSLVAGGNFLDAIAITAPADRQYPVDGAAAIATAAQLFAGDAVYVTYVTTGAVDPSGKVLAVVLVYD